MHYFKKKFLEEKSFSIIEMLVSIGIISMILAVVVFNQGDFTDRFSLMTNINDLELNIRQAQTYGISVKEFAPSTNEFTSAYGISVNTTTGYDGSYFTMFADRGSLNGVYDGTGTCEIGGTSECIQNIVFSRNIKINQVCAIKLNSQAECAPEVGRADITFIRPDPSAHVVFFNSQGNQNNLGNVAGVEIQLISPRGNTKSILIYTNGQVSIQ